MAPHLFPETTSASFPVMVNAYPQGFCASAGPFQSIASKAAEQTVNSVRVKRASMELRM